MSTPKWTKYAESINELDLEVQALKAELAHAIEASAEIQALKREVDAKCKVICDLRAELATQRQSWAEHGAHMAKDAILKLVMSLGWRTSLVQKINRLTVATLLKGSSK